jgi:uncharacterized membrane protein HdeD (DUF308 family)
MASDRPVIAQAKKFTTWYIIAAIVFILAGMFAIAEPAMAALGITILVGWLLIFGAVAHLVATFRGGGTAKVLWELLSAVVFGVGGFYMLSHPLMALGSLTLLLAAVIVAVGIFEIITYFRLQREHPSGWILANGIIALILGGLIWAHWPSSSVWAIGTLVGVNLLFTGITRLMFGLAGRKLVKSAAGQ